MRASKGILLSIFSIPLVLSKPVAEPNVSPKVDFDFQELLAVLPAESLHAALHKHVDTKFKDGVYEHERIAVVRVHNDDPDTATKVLAEAALHLLKRQSANDTSATTGTETATATTTSSATPATTTKSSPPDVIVPVVVSTTNSQGSATTLTTSAVASPTVSVEQQVTTTNAEGSTVVATQTVAAAVVTQSGVVTTSPVPTFVPDAPADPTQPVDVTATGSDGQTVVLSSVTPGKVVTATDAHGGVFVTTYTPHGGTVSSLVLQTTQLPNGQLTTVTSFAVVAADTAVASSSSGPKLQNGADSVRSPALPMAAVTLLCAAFGAALML